MNVIITGASSGVGYEATLELLAGGNNVLAIARSEDKLQTLKSYAESKTSTLHTLPFDIVNGNYNQDLVPLIQNHFDKIDVLINNAGALINKSFSNLTDEDFTGMIEANYLGHVKMVKAILPLMRKGSHIVNIGSMGGYQGSVKFPGLAAYSASKAALHVLTECLAQELVDEEIKVNCLALGSAQTEMLAKAFPGYNSPVSAKEMGKYIADFAVNGSKYFNGKIIPVSVTTP
jgi:short-subunit dehydrogenase